MPTFVNHDLRVNNGMTLYHPPYASGQLGFGNMALPDVYHVDQVQQYPLGTRLVYGERSFRYTKLDTESWLDIILSMLRYWTH